MVVLKRISIAGIAMAVLTGCGRDFSESWSAAPSDSGSVAVAKPVSPPQAKKDSSSNPVKSAILIESLSAADLRMKVGETKPAPVTVAPSNATSPLYEMTSSKPGVAEANSEGIHGTGAGSATITVHALDGSGKTTHFHVIVDAVVDSCLLLPCLCLGKLAGKGNGKGKEEESGGGDGNGTGTGDGAAGVTKDPCGG